MYDTLMKYKNCKKFNDYEESINNLYNMYYEMLNEKVNENINIYDKANELDKYYEEVNNKKPLKFCDVRYLIIDDYKSFNPEYEKERRKGWKTTAFTTEFVREELRKEDCELINEYINSTTPIEYLYKGQIYRVKFSNWRHKKYRPHLNKFPGAHYWH